MSMLPGVWLAEWPCIFATTSKMRSSRPLTHFGGMALLLVEVLVNVVHPARHSSFTLASVLEGLQYPGPPFPQEQL